MAEEDLSPSVRAWEARGRRLRLPGAGREVFWMEAGDATAPPLLLLHGFPTASHDFHRVLPALEARHRVVMLDLLGFGLSDKPDDYSYSLLEQADVVEAVCEAAHLPDAHVLAHDMSTSVACELAARIERGRTAFRLRSLALMNGSVHIELSSLTISQRLLLTPLANVLLRLSRFATFALQMRRIFGRPDALPDEDLRDMWTLIRHCDGHLRLPAIMGYVAERTRFRERWIGALTRLQIPALVLWGRRDPVAVPAIAETLAAEIPGARLRWMEALGHYPQLEDPDLVAREILAFTAPA
ncbi:MAG TPA: alpha/beta hydrolase [Myxococcota bacterium]|jgi:pimeloyl-ACP methyl ester carboxylesterase|nr:alpha/beta hydrolase [Myxococcota bacterium]